MIKKTVTDKKLAANRKNAKRSTGPRTEWGKTNSKFNAVKAGLFAEEVVIPECDGENAARTFSELLSDLQNEFVPVGRFEKLLVETAAHGFWRMRRATLAESGATRIEGYWDKCHDLPKDSLIDRLNRSVDVQRFCLEMLNQAKNEIGRTGTLSKESYQKIRTLVEEQSPDQSNNADIDTTVDPVFDDNFVQRIEKKAESLKLTILQVDIQVVARMRDFLKQAALPPAEEAERISRCRMRAQNEIRWALHTLFLVRERTLRGSKSPERQRRHESEDHNNE